MSSTTFSILLCLSGLAIFLFLMFGDRVPDEENTPSPPPDGDWWLDKTLDDHRKDRIAQELELDLEAPPEYVPSRNGS